MYYRWQDERIVVKVAVWAATKGTAAQFLHTLSDEVLERADAGEYQEPGDQQAVGIRRNARPRDVEEPDRRFSLYFFHPPGEAGEFQGTPVDFKLVAPEAPVEGNRAYRTALESASAVIFIAEGGDDADSVNETALQALISHVTDAQELDRGADQPPLEAIFGTNAPLDLRVIAAPSGSHDPDPEGLRRTLQLPEAIDVVAGLPWNGPDALEQMLGLARTLRPRIEAAGLPPS